MKFVRIARRLLWSAGAAALVAAPVAAGAHTPCTGYPLTATVNIYHPGSPFSPQTVNICHGGYVIFHNVNSGADWTIRHLSGPGFPNVPVPMSNPVNQTQVFSHPGTTVYRIRGNPQPDFVLPGTIIIH